MAKNRGWDAPYIGAMLSYHIWKTGNPSAHVAKVGSISSWERFGQSGCRPHELSSNDTPIRYGIIGRRVYTSHCCLPSWHGPIRLSISVFVHLSVRPHKNNGWRKEFTSCLRSGEPIEKGLLRNRWTWKELSNKRAPFVGQSISINIIDFSDIIFQSGNRKPMWRVKAVNEKWNAIRVCRAKRTLLGYFGARQGAAGVRSRNGVIDESTGVTGSVGWCE